MQLCGTYDMWYMPVFVSVIYFMMCEKCGLNASFKDATTDNIDTVRFLHSVLQTNPKI